MRYSGEGFQEQDSPKQTISRLKPYCKLYIVFTRNVK